MAAIANGSSRVVVTRTGHGKVWTPGNIGTLKASGFIVDRVPGYGEKIFVSRRNGIVPTEADIKAALGHDHFEFSEEAATPAPVAA